MPVPCSCPLFPGIYIYVVSDQDGHKKIGRLTAVGLGIEETGTGRGTVRAAQIFYPLLDRSFGPKSKKVVKVPQKTVQTLISLCPFSSVPPAK